MTINQLDATSLDGSLASLDLLCGSKLTNAQDDLGCSVMSRAHDGAMVLVVECRASEIDEIDLRSEEHSSELSRSRGQCTR